MTSEPGACRLGFCPPLDPGCMAPAAGCTTGYFARRPLLRNTLLASAPIDDRPGAPFPGRRGDQRRERDRGGPGVDDPNDNDRINFELIGSITSAGTDAA